MMGMAGDRTAAMLLLLLVVSSWCAAAEVAGYREREREREGREEEEKEPWEGEGQWGGERGGRVFVLEESKQVVKSEGGEVRVVTGFRTKSGRGGAGGRRPRPVHIGFISMEPNTLFIPQYLDSSLILFVRRGEVKVGWIYKDNLVERQLKMGDINYIPAGSAFYMVNTGRGQRLQIICSIDASDSLPGFGPYQSFFIGGGLYPPSVLSGFDIDTLTTAFNVTSERLRSILEAQTRGPIITVTGRAADQPHDLASLVQLKHRDAGHKRGVDDDEDEEEEGGAVPAQDEGETWTWRKLFDSLLGGRKSDDRRGAKKRGRGDAPDPYNLYDSDPGFRNDYGWSIAVDRHDYPPLKHSDVGVYLVNLTAGSMMAPHVNPRATEYGVVIGGSGTIQVVYPNGTTAMNAEVAEGDVFWIPRFFPFCQLASRSGPLEFFGFTTSARGNRPQFLVGASSVLRSMLGPELAAGFGVSEAELRRVVEAQKEAVIIPSWPLHEGGKGRREEERGERKKGEPLFVRKMADV